MSAESDSTNRGEPASGTPGLGRRILLGVGATVVVLAGVVGFFIGSNGAETAPRVAVLGGLVTIPTTPLSMSLYAALVAAGVLTVLFGLVAVASRYEDAN
ncbi:DUF7520 family protein [Halopelagius longus]|uniref:Cox cluster protein n=1 Tax=Halopelagius longus TaxID=1236180 RepID=A0A1H1AJ92_9EURY|nr:hypothetical protein [Halopelagius longus]RDI70396.1 hypothetical protein DWB78_00950 [Halopelagius longus]SDQ39702.1 hypothetical protein SAMN05216278_1360 [Halopelagius longus]